MCRLLSLLAGLVLLFCTFELELTATSPVAITSKLCIVSPRSIRTTFSTRSYSQNTIAWTMFTAIVGARLSAYSRTNAPLLPPLPLQQQQYAKRMLPDGLRMKQYLPLFHLAGRRLVRVL